MQLSGKSAKSFRWRSIVRLRSQGLSQRAIGEALSIDQSSVSRILQRYKRLGERAFEVGSAPGAERRMSDQDLELLKRLIDQGARAHGYEDDSWSCKRIRDLILAHFKVSYHERHVSRILKLIGYTRQKPQLKDRRQDAQKVSHWKQEKLPEIKKS